MPLPRFTCGYPTFPTPPHVIVVVVGPVWYGGGRPHWWAWLAVVILHLPDTPPPFTIQLTRAPFPTYPYARIGCVHPTAPCRHLMPRPERLPRTRWTPSRYTDPPPPPRLRYPAHTEKQQPTPAPIRCRYSAWFRMVGRCGSFKAPYLVLFSYSPFSVGCDG